MRHGRPSPVGRAGRLVLGARIASVDTPTRRQSARRGGVRPDSRAGHRRPCACRPVAGDPLPEFVDPGFCRQGVGRHGVDARIGQRAGHPRDAADAYFDAIELRRFERSTNMVILPRPGVRFRKTVSPSRSSHPIAKRVAMGIAEHSICATCSSTALEEEDFVDHVVRCIDEIPHQMGTIRPIIAAEGEVVTVLQSPGALRTVVGVEVHGCSAGIARHQMAGGWLQPRPEPVSR